MPEGGLVLAQSSNARHRFRRSVLAALVAVLAATLFTVPSAGATAPSSPSTGTGSAAVPQLDWATCAGEGLEAFECATAVVPLDYDRPKGEQITLALSRLPAGDPSRKIGSLFLNSGGPGASGVEFVQAPGRSSTPTRSGPASTWSASTPAASSAAPRCAATRRSTRPWPTWPRSRSR
jgi:hypothetical protein